MLLISDLPKDAIWLIFKHYLMDVLFVMNGRASATEKISVHVHEFYGRRACRSMCYPMNLFEKTFCENIEYKTTLNRAYLIDFVYPLRLVCKQFDLVIRNKMPRRTEPSCMYHYAPRFVILH